MSYKPKSKWFRCIQDEKASDINKNFKKIEIFPLNRNTNTYK